MDSSAAGDATSTDFVSINEKVVLTFRHPVSSLSDLETVQGSVKPVYHVHALQMIQKLEKNLDVTALNPTKLHSCFRLLLPAKNAGYCSSDSIIFSASLFSAVAVAVNFNNIIYSAQKDPESIHCVLSCLVEATKVQKIIAMSQALNGKESKVPLSSALQELATKLPTTISVHGDVSCIAEDTESMESDNDSDAQSLVTVFQPKSILYADKKNMFGSILMLGSDTSVNLAFSSYTGGFWVLIPRSIISQYKDTCKINQVLRARLVELGIYQQTTGAFFTKHRNAHVPEQLNVGGGNMQFYGLCSSLHNIMIDQHRKLGLLLPAFTQHGILRILAQQRGSHQQQSTSAASVVMQLDSVCTQALLDVPALDRAIGMVFGQHFFDPASTHYFLCVSAALLSNLCPLSDGMTGFHLDCMKFYADCSKLLCNMGPSGSQLAPSAMPAAIAVAAVLTLAMPVNQALVCWESFNRGMADMHHMSTGVKSAGCLLISLLTFTRQPSEGLQSGLKSANQILHCFFELLQSEDQGVQQLKTLFLSDAGLDASFLSSEDFQSIGEVLWALRVVCQNQDIFQCLKNINPGKPSSSIVGLVAGALTGFSGLSKMSHLPSIHLHQAAQLRAVTSILENCHKVSVCICSAVFSVNLI